MNQAQRIIEEEKLLIAEVTNELSMEGGLEKVKKEFKNLITKDLQESEKISASLRENRESLKREEPLMRRLLLELD